MDLTGAGYLRAVFVGRNALFAPTPVAPSAPAQAATRAASASPAAAASSASAAASVFYIRGLYTPDLLSGPGTMGEVHGGGSPPCQPGDGQRWAMRTM